MHYSSQTATMGHTGDEALEDSFQTNQSEIFFRLPQWVIRIPQMRIQSKNGI